MNNKPSSKKIIRVVLVLLVLLVAGIFILKGKPSQFQNVKNDQINWRIPNLPDGFNWVESEANQEFWTHWQYPSMQCGYLNHH